MTKKDYELIASIMHIYNTAMQSNEELLPEYRVTGSSLMREVSLKFADTLEQENDRFNKQKFLRACNVL